MPGIPESEFSRMGTGDTVIDVAVAFSRPARLVRVALGPFLVIGIGGVAGVLYDAVHIPHYLFQGPMWVARCLSWSCWLAVVCGAWLIHCFVDGLL